MTSAFIVRADTFAVINPNDATVMGDRISPETDMSQMPFAILSGGTDTATGVDVTAGVYMKEAFMNRASIMTLLAGYIQADVLKAGAISSGSTVLTPTINVGAITNPLAHPWQWTWNGASNRVTDFSVKNGIMHANYGVLKGMTIQAFDGTELFRSGGPRLGTGGSLINNGDFIGETVYNEAANLGGSGSTAIVLGAGWTKSTSTGVSFADGTVTINASSYIDSEFFPITPGEDLYAEVTGTGLTTSNVSVTVVGYSSASPPAYISGGSASASGTSWDINSSTAASAKITVSSTSTVRLGKLRLSVPAGQSAVTFNSVFIGRSPRHIAANYASTYIRNAAVDTLQIAGNAATVPSSANYGAGSSLSNATQTVITNSPLGVNYGSNAPTKVICLGSCVVANVGGYGGDWAAAGLELRYNNSSSTTISGSTLVQRVQINARKGAPPSIVLQKTIDGWTGTRYFFLTLEVTGESGSASGWWKSGSSNISLLGSKR